MRKPRKLRGKLARRCRADLLSLSAQYPATPAWAAAVNIADALLYAVKLAGRNGWMGALGTRDETPEAVLSGLRRPVADWARSGNLEVVCSPVSRTPGHGP